MASWSMQCAYKGCTVRNTGNINMSFHKFPSKNIERCREWKRRCGRAENWGNKSRRICSNHFMDCDYASEKKGGCMRLKRTALPLDYNDIVNANSPSSSHSQDSNNCSTSENSSTLGTSFQENRKEKIQTREKTIKNELRHSVAQTISNSGLRTEDVSFQGSLKRTKYIFATNLGIPEGLFIFSQSIRIEIVSTEATNIFVTLYDPLLGNNSYFSSPIIFVLPNVKSVLNFSNPNLRSFFSVMNPATWKIAEISSSSSTATVTIFGSIRFAIFGEKVYTLP